MKPGEVIGERFEIAEQAGAGGMGVVYRAKDLRTGAPVAVKVLVGHRVVQHARFARESEVLASFDHPAVVHYIAHGATPQGEAFLAMEWLEGESLSARLTAARLSLHDTCTLASRIAGALAVAHRAGVVHRDVKPSNIMLVGREVNRATLVDFGVARVADRTVLTATGGMIGTVGYMAPEQARGDGAIDARADVFALGAVIFRCLAGRPPFEGGEPLTLLVRLINEDAPRLSSVLEGVPPTVDDLLARMLSRNLAQRPPDGAAVLAEIAELGMFRRGPPLAHRALPPSEPAHPAWSTAPQSVSNTSPHAPSTSSFAPPSLAGVAPLSVASAAPSSLSMSQSMASAAPPTFAGTSPPTLGTAPPSVAGGPPPSATGAPPPPFGAPQPSPAMAPQPPTARRFNRNLFVVAGIGAVALALAALGGYVMHGSRVATVWSGASGPCNWERCERVDLPSTIDIAQLLPKIRAAVVGQDRSAALVAYLSVVPIKNGQIDTARQSPVAMFRISSTQPGRNTIMATLYKGRIEMRWTDSVYDKPLPDPRCSGAKLTAAARAHGVAGDQGFFYYAYAMLPAGPGWTVSMTQPKPAVAMVSDRTCEPL